MRRARTPLARGRPSSTAVRCFVADDESLTALDPVSLTPRGATRRRAGAPHLAAAAASWRSRSHGARARGASVSSEPGRGSRRASGCPTRRPDWVSRRPGDSTSPTRARAPSGRIARRAEGCSRPAPIRVGPPTRPARRAPRAALRARGARHRGRRPCGAHGEAQGDPPCDALRRLGRTRDRPSVRDAARRRPRRGARHRSLGRCHGSSRPRGSRSRSPVRRPPPLLWSSSGWTAPSPDSTPVPVDASTRGESPCSGRLRLRRSCSVESARPVRAMRSRSSWR